VCPAFEPDNTPATLSQRILTGLLRSRLGFQGVIVTDCLEMKAIAETIGVARGAVEAIKAGADLVLVSHRLHRQKAALEAVMEAVLAGELSEARIDEAARRIWELKQARGLFGNERPAAERAQAEAVRAELCERAITIVRGEKHLPLDPRNKIVAVWTEPRERTEVIEVIAQEWTLGAALAQQGYTVKEIRIGTDPSAEEAAAVKTAAGTGSQVVFASYDAAFSASQAALIRELNADRQLPLIWAATRTPYDLLAVPEAPVYVCAYENKPAMMTALAALLSGKLRAQARQPITIGPHARASAKD
jgi:beta-N-acetylhexosaminidase